MKFNQVIDRIASNIQRSSLKKNFRLQRYDVINILNWHIYVLQDKFELKGLLLYQNDDLHMYNYMTCDKINWILNTIETKTTSLINWTISVELLFYFRPYHLNLIAINTINSKSIH